MKYFKNGEQGKSIIYNEKCDRLVDDALNSEDDDDFNKFSEIINLYPECDYAYIIIGCIYKENNEYKNAISYFEKAIEVNNIFTYWAYAELGCCNEGLNKLDKAFEYYEKSLKLSKKNEIASYYLADFLVYKKNDFKKAEPIAKYLVDEFPEEEDYHRLYADILCHFDKIKEANEEYKKALEISSDNPLTLNNYGMFFLINNECETAKKYFQRAAEINPTSDLFKENLYQAKLRSTKYYKLKMKYLNGLLRPILDKPILLGLVLAIWFPVIKFSLKFSAKYTISVGNIILYKTVILITCVFLLIIFSIWICDFIIFILIKLGIIK